MKFIKKIVIVSAALFACAALDLRAEDKPQEQMTETREDIQKKITKIFDNFIPTLLTAQDKVLFDNLQLSLSSIVNRILPHATEEQEARKIQVLSLFCVYEKNLHAKMELVALQLPLITQQIQHLQLQALNMLCKKVSTYCALLHNKKKDSGFKFSNQDLSDIVEKIIAQELPNLLAAKQIKDFGKLSIWPWFWPNDTKILIHYLWSKWKNRKIISKNYFLCDYSLLYSDLYDLYSKVIKQYREATYVQLDILINTAIEKHEQKRQEIETLLLDNSLIQRRKEDLLRAQEIISLYLSKLLAIKNELFGVSVQEDPIKAVLLSRYAAITINPHLNKVMATNREVATLYNSVQKIFSIFKTTNELPQHIVLELISTFERLEDFLRYNATSAIGKWTAEPNPTDLLVSQMASLLENTSEYLCAKTTNPFVKNIISYAAAASKTSIEDPAGPYQKIIIETAQHVTGKKFDNLKDVGLHFLSHASPSITAYFLSLILPQLGPEAKQFLSGMLNKPTETQPTQELIDEMDQYLNLAEPTEI